MGLGVPRVVAVAQQAQRARDVAIAADTLLAGLLNAETGQRGFLLTGDDDYLTPYRAAQVALGDAIAGIESIVAEPDTAEPLAIVLRQLLAAARAKRAELEATLRQYVEVGPQAALETVRSGEGKRSMDEAARRVAQSHAMTDAMARRALEDADAMLRWGGLVVIGLLTIAFGAGLRGQRVGRERERLVAARTRAIVETAPLGIAMLDAEHRFLLANDAMCDMAEQPSAGLLGHRVDEAMPLPLVPAVLALLQRAVARPGLPAEATIDGAESPRGRRSWLAMARADLARGQRATFILLMQDITTRRAAEAERVLLMHELNHRVKNVIATVQGLATQSWSGAEGDGDLFIEIFGARLRSLARAHGLLTAAGWRHAPLNDVLRVALAPWLDETAAGLTITGGAGKAPLLGPQQVLGLALVLHELATNATKYGALSVPEGTVALEWTLEDSGLVRLTWREAGGPLLSGPPQHEGFGSFLIDRAFDSDATPGEVTREFLPTGLVATFRFAPDTSAETAAGQGIA